MDLTNEEEKFIRSWAKQEQRGKYFYIISFGLLWGTAVAIGSKFLSDYGDAGFWASFTSPDFLIKLLIYNIIGVGIYTYHWHSKSKRYKQLKNIQDKSLAVQQ